MFMTQWSFEAPIGKPFGSSRYWHLVESTDDEPWFYATVRYENSGPGKRRQYLCSSIDQVVTLINDCHDQFWIERIMLVTPPAVNGTDHDQMELLDTVTVAIDRRNPRLETTIYELDSGGRYVHGECQDQNELTVVAPI